ncbi:MAG: hypothetical protein RSE93_00665 [Oscillospiraceae bacterium]
MTALIVIASIIVFFAIILSFSITFYVAITDDISLKVGIFGIKINLITKSDDEVEEKSKPKQKINKKSNRGKSKKSKEKSKEKVKVDNKSFFETAKMVIELIKSALKPTAKALKKIRLTNLKAYILVGNDCADKTAMSYVAVASAFYNSVNVLNSIIKVKIKQISIHPDFVSNESKYDISFKIKLRLSTALGCLISILFKLLKTFIKLKNK